MPQILPRMCPQSYRPDEFLNDDVHDGYLLLAGRAELLSDYLRNRFPLPHAAFQLLTPPAASVQMLAR